MLLLLCGNVYVNPGPQTQEKLSETQRQRLREILAGKARIKNKILRLGKKHLDLAQESEQSLLHEVVENVFKEKLDVAVKTMARVWQKISWKGEAIDYLTNELHREEPYPVKDKMFETL